MPDKLDKNCENEDERVIAPMNVEGMPWYREHEPAPKNPNAEPISDKNLWRYAFSAVGAGLLIVAVFGVAAAAFIWFCVNVWFR
ncbi:MAG: hypothetical protein RR653_03715 [Clostridia bacterium]